MGIKKGPLGEKSLCYAAFLGPRLSFFVSFPGGEGFHADEVQQERGDLPGGAAVAQVREGGSPLHPGEAGGILQKNRK